MSSDEEFAGAVERSMRASEAGCSCEEVAKHLFELLDAQMPDQTARRLQRHCETCPHCSQLADAEVHVREILRRSCCAEAAPQTLRVRITRQIAVFRTNTA
ncbi:MAG: mycothiol system anti-sigma-R factor [Actinomycetaceae bacterium]|nr:mycothiol system anti-sigma-R factor [Actinomycetaceae bacterium]